MLIMLPLFMELTEENKVQENSVLRKNWGVGKSKRNYQPRKMRARSCFEKYFQ